MSYMEAAQPYQNAHKLRKGIILTVILTLLFLFIIGAGIASLLSNRTSQAQQSDNAASQGATQGTDAPTTKTNTPSDRTVPSPNGGNANTILTP